MTPVEELFQLLWDTPKDKLTWFAIKNRMLKKEKEAIISYAHDWAIQEMFSVTRKEIEEDFDKTFNTADEDFFESVDDLRRLREEEIQQEVISKTFNTKEK